MKIRSVLLAGCFGSMLIASTLIAGTIAPGDVKIENIAVSESLTGIPGNASEGRKTFANRKLGNCLACHANADLSEQLFHGEVGPSLDGAGSRWSEQQLRAIMVNAKAIFSDRTIMPAFYSLEVGENVRKDLIGKTILTAEQIEDLVAYLLTLK
ncbi:MAG: sulfur oxidation c-type cytochrome SoxX [Granulosicoccus sp.]